MIESLIQFFENIPSSTRTIFLVSGLAFFFFLEKGIPIYKYKYNKIKHVLLNLSLTLTTLIINLAGAFLIIICAPQGAPKGGTMEAERGVRRLPIYLESA